MVTDFSLSELYLLANFVCLSLPFIATHYPKNFPLRLSPSFTGVAATEQMRKIEAQSGSHSDWENIINDTSSRTSSPEQAPERHTKILALTGMSSLEDKRRAFDAGVDG